MLSTFLMGQKADENNALLNGIVTDYSQNVIANEKVSFYSHKTKTTKYGITNAEGKFKILLSKGDTYSVKLMSFDEDVVFSEIPVPQQAGLIEFDYQIKYELPKTYVLENVYFDTGKASLKSESYASLNNLVKVLKAKKSMVIEIGGHTDNVGSSESNQALSQRRADAVKKYLVSKGVASAQIQTKGYGDSQPIEYNETPEGRQKNRRTQITVLKP
jgi:outer membrane protein OmpA-like peptidoglycan-associated protein